MTLDDLKIPLLASSVLFFLIALYFYVLRRWKFKAKSLQYPHLFSLDDRRIKGILRIRFELYFEDEVQVNILDSSEEEIEHIVSDKREKGVHEVPFDTSNLIPGLYYYQLITSNQKTIKRFEKI